MSVFDCIRTRRAIRDFESRDIPEDVLKTILEAGRLAPSAKNTQPWHFIVIRDKEVLQQITQATPSGPHIPKAPLSIAVAMKEAKYPDLDAARAVQNMTLVAWEHGIGTCYIGNWVTAKAKQILGLPDDYALITVMPFGYPSEGPRVARKKQRRKIGELVSRDRFGASYY